MEVEKVLVRKLSCLCDPPCTSYLSMNCYLVKHDSNGVGFISLGRAHGTFSCCIIQLTQKQTNQWCNVLSIVCQLCARCEMFYHYRQYRWKNIVIILLFMINKCISVAFFERLSFFYCATVKHVFITVTLSLSCHLGPLVLAQRVNGHFPPRST